MMRSHEVQALRDAGEVLHALADVIAKQQYDRLPAAVDLGALADRCHQLAEKADDEMLAGERFVDEPGDHDDEGR